MLLGVVRTPTVPPTVTKITRITTILLPPTIAHPVVPKDMEEKLEEEKEERKGGGEDRLANCRIRLLYMDKASLPAISIFLSLRPLTRPLTHPLLRPLIHPLTHPFNPPSNTLVSTL